MWGKRTDSTGVRAPCLAAQVVARGTQSAITDSTASELSQHRRMPAIHDASGRWPVDSLPRAMSASDDVETQSPPLLHFEPFLVKILDKVRGWQWLAKGFSLGRIATRLPQ